MPANKCYSTREQVLDELLRKENGATVLEMMERCNKVLHDAGFKEVSAQNTILNDMVNIENRYGDDAKIEKLRDPLDRRIIYYRYIKRDFSIYKVELTLAEAECLRSAMDVLSRFQGLPQNSWITELDVRMSAFLKNETGNRQIVGFDTIPNYSGNKYLIPLFKAIVKQQTLTLDCVLMNGTALSFDVWPYYIKQSGHSWFLIAANVKNGQLDGFGLDGITAIRECGIPYQPCSTDLEKYFDERVGASSSWTYREPVTITLVANADAQKFLMASPIHHTQKVIRTLDNGDVIMQIHVVYTRELLDKLCRFGGDVTVLSPADMRHTVARCHAEALQHYGYDTDLDSLDEIVTDGADAMAMDNPVLELPHPITGKTMKVLNLTIEKQELGRILSGEKARECREIRPSNLARYIELDDDGYKKEDENQSSIPIHYDAIQFVTFDTPEPESALVEIRDTWTQMFTDKDSGDLITYHYQNNDWIAQQVIYELGKELNIENK